ncbi:hypothetical protein [Tenggerimyces flavus]|uniref:DUF485 domain-containing protein n=1 Tax=Tenggerimyces flavus TaxID=1708749 RepID=A0ABV7Y828_9ACTN|nr:hypothetical protein [Tenggerimyces flavus]MBM7783463.1 hypothetical protein [Tenggerimyces flavus]
MSQQRPEPPPKRVVVTSPRMNASRRQRQRVSREIDAQTRLGEVYMRTLIRAQLRLGLLVLAVVGVLLLGLPALFALAPELTSVRALGLPLPWLLLGVLAHPALIGAAWFYVRQAERNERDFTDLVERS